MNSDSFHKNDYFHLFVVFRRTKKRPTALNSYAKPNRNNKTNSIVLDILPVIYIYDIYICMNIHAH